MTRAQALYWVDSSKEIPVEVKPSKLWTWLCNTQKPELPNEPLHRINAYREVENKDWFWRSGFVSYNSQIVDHDVWVLLEWE